MGYEEKDSVELDRFLDTDCVIVCYYIFGYRIFSRYCMKYKQA